MLISKLGQLLPIINYEDPGPHSWGPNAHMTPAPVDFPLPYLIHFTAFSSLTVTLPWHSDPLH